MTGVQTCALPISSTMMKVPARNIPLASRPNDLPTKVKLLTIKKVTAIANHIPIPPQRGVISLCISRDLSCKNAPEFNASLLTKGVTKKDSNAASVIVNRYSRTYFE